jgi:hypothetical protein
MTTIIIKNADYSGGRLVGYTPPIADASLCAFFGGSLQDCVRNFGTGADLTPVGFPTILDEYSARLNSANFFNSEITQGAAMTVMCVVKPELNTGGNLTDRAIICGTAGIDAGTDRSGFEVSLLSPGTAGNWLQPTGTMNRGVVGSGSTSIAAAASGPTGLNPFPFQFLSFTFEKRTSDSLFAVQGRNLSSGFASSVVVSTGVTDYTPPARTVRVGSYYRTEAGAITRGPDLAHLTIVPRVLSLSEQTAMYNSVKRRMAAFGITV